MEPMRKPPRLQKRNHRFYCRVAVPHALRAVLGRNEVIKALGTGDYAEALRRLPLASAGVDATFAQARRRLATGPTTALDDHGVRQLALLWLHQTELTATKAEVTRGVTMGRADALAQAEADLATLADTDDDGTLAAVQAEADQLMRENNVQLDKDAPAYGLLCQLVGRGMAESTRRGRDRLLGDYSARHHDPVFEGVGAESPQPTAPATVTLAGLVERFLDDPSRSAGAKEDNDYRVVLRFLAEFTPEDTPVRRVTRDNCREVAALLKRLPANVSKKRAFRGMRPLQAAAEAERLGMPPMSPTTANSYISKMSALFRWAAREGLTERNVAEGLLLPEDTLRRDARLPFSVDQLNVIFSSDIYGEERGAWDHRQWAPLVALFSGLRLNEVCTLRCDDVAARDGVMVIHVRPDEAGRKKLKSKAARRAVPVHPTLVKVGFLRFVERQRAGGDLLFPTLRPDRRGYFSDQFQRWFGRHLSQIGAKTAKTSFHSFRHNFRDALREAGVSRDAVLALGGWAGNGGTEEIYGGGLKASTLAREIAKVKYPGLELDHLEAK